MEELIEYLQQNNYHYEIEFEPTVCLYRVAIKKGNKGIIRHYPYNIDNLVSPKDLIEDIESEFNERPRV